MFDRTSAQPCSSRRGKSYEVIVRPVIKAKNTYRLSINGITTPS
jgi:hypothetical protein